MKSPGCIARMIRSAPAKWKSSSPISSSIVSPTRERRAFKMSQLIHQILDTATVLWPSFLMALAVAISASFVGVFVLLRREGLAALAMPQIVAIGAAIGLRMRWPGLPPALAAVVVAVLLLVWSKRRGYDHWLLPSLYIAGLSFSFIIIANAGAHVEE